ncbi:LOW QUALITY PROTEIN: selenoprotein K-like [Halichondria panicea]|uniref:LOW QUALITY PROTEIN: selenoprotein K-like n=1 Tax=Halichondria panicea TaxID=6063 RepID=UPI00312B2B98
MVYLSGGKVLENRSWLSVDGIVDLFWAVINFFVLFCKTLISPGASAIGLSRSTDYRRSGVADQGRRIGRVGKGAGGGAGPPPMGGG